MCKSVSEELHSKVKRLGSSDLDSHCRELPWTVEKVGLALSAWTRHECLHSVRKGWPGALPELSPVTHYARVEWAQDRILQAFPGAQPFRHGTDGAPGVGGWAGGSLHSSPTEQVFLAKDTGLVLPCPLNPECLSHL